MHHQLQGIHSEFALRVSIILEPLSKAILRRHSQKDKYIGFRFTSFIRIQISSTTVHAVMSNL